MKQLFVIGAIVALAACQGENSTERAVGEAANKWAEAYFNWDFPEAANYVTTESERWLRYAASNVTEADLEQLRQLDAAITIEAVDMGNDTSATATIRVADFLRQDSIGRAGSRMAEGLFHILLVKRDNKWKVRMEGLPQSERQSHD